MALLEIFFEALLRFFGVVFGAIFKILLSFFEDSFGDSFVYLFVAPETWLPAPKAPGKQGCSQTEV